jgi:hypothetical protein
MSAIHAASQVRRPDAGGGSDTARFSLKTLGVSAQLRHLTPGRNPQSATRAHVP